MKKYCLRLIFSLLVFISILELVGRYMALQPSDIVYHYIFKENSEKVFKQYSVDISTYISRQDFPKDWVGNYHLTEQTIADAVDNIFDRSRFLRALSEDIEKYPKDIIKNNLTTLYLINNFTIKGAKVSGSYNVEKQAIYLLNSHSYRISKERIKKTFHHEMSSILKNNYHFNKNLWRAAAGDKFLYKVEEDPAYLWMQLHGHTEKIDQQTLLARGLLRQYGETGIENDFNIYAAEIFTNPQRIKKLIGLYPIIQRKYQVFKDFYLSIDPGFAPVFYKIDG